MRGRSSLGGRNSLSSTAGSNFGGGGGGGPAPPAAAEEYGQGWTQMTEHGKIYLSTKEKNVFIIEGTTPAGFSASVYTGSPEQQELVASGNYSLTVELKCVPGDQCRDQQIYVVLDCLSMADLSSGCDFCGLSVKFDSREIRVENHRRNASKQTLRAQPNCALLRSQTYSTLSVNVCDDSISLSLSGVSLFSGVPMNRAAFQQPGATPRVGIAVYGRTRCYLRRFRIAALSPEAAHGDSGGSLALAGAPAASARRDSAGRRAGGAAYQSASTLPVPTPSPQQPQQQQQAPPPNIMGQSAGAGCGPSLACEEMELAALIERDIVCRDLHVRFEDIGGLEEAKRAINEAVLLPLILPEFFMGIRQPWKGVLLFGPPGTGKTMLAKAVASSSENVTFFNCSSATLTSKWRGESEKLLRALFNTARARVPSILFFDEIDSLLAQRGSAAEHEASRRFKSEFLIHLDGLLSDAGQADGQAAGHLLVLATSNAPWDLDEALRRRLEKRIYIPLPCEEARLRMFQHHLRDIPKSDDVNIIELAARTENYSGADVKLICRDASMNPMRRAVNGLSPAEMVRLRDEGALTPGGMPVEMRDFEAALSAIQPSVALADCRRYAEWSQEFGSK